VEQRGPSSFWVPRKLSLSMDRQARTGDTRVRREMTDRTTEYTECQAFYPVVRKWAPSHLHPREESVAPPPPLGPRGRRHTRYGHGIGILLIVTLYLQASRSEKY
jgi:hypothetical protein